MLIRFSVENHLSLRERVHLSFVPSAEEKAHPDHVVPAPHLKGFGLLKLAVVYGANASGKSNLVHAIATAQQIILHSAEAGARLPVRPFKLDAESRGKPSRFEFEIQFQERSFAYGFIVSSERIHEEWLFEIGQEGETPLFERNGGFRFPGIRFTSEQEKQYLDFTAKGTLANRLFLTECRERNVRANVPSAAVLSDVLEWFTNKLTVIVPNAEYTPLVHRVGADGNFKEDLGRFLRTIGTGIESVELKDVTLDGKLRLTEEDLARLADILGNERVVEVRRSDAERFVVFRGEQGLKAQRLVFKHGKGNDPAALFEMVEESDGTRRFLDLAPALLLLLRGDRVIVIDEFDRSLHSEVAHSFLANFLRYSSARGSQLIVTTHETTLLERDFLRRDEVWLMEKGPNQVSTLASLVEYKPPPADADLRQDYLNGRYGGVPVLLDFSWLGERHAAGTS